MSAWTEFYRDYAKGFQINSPQEAREVMRQAGEEWQARKNPEFFQDANGIIHPIRGTAGYSRGLAGDNMTSDIRTAKGRARKMIQRRLFNPDELIEGECGECGCLLLVPAPEQYIICPECGNTLEVPR